MVFSTSHHSSSLLHKFWTSPSSTRDGTFQFIEKLCVFLATQTSTKQLCRTLAQGKIITLNVPLLQCRQEFSIGIVQRFHIWLCLCVCSICQFNIAYSFICKSVHCSSLLFFISGEVGQQMMHQSVCPFTALVTMWQSLLCVEIFTFVCGPLRSVYRMMYITIHEQLNTHAHVLRKALAWALCGPCMALASPHVWSYFACKPQHVCMCAPSYILVSIDMRFTVHYGYAPTTKNYPMECVYTDNKLLGEVVLSHMD